MIFMQSRKGMELALGVVITVVVLVVVSLAIITIATKSAAETGTSTSAQSKEASCYIAIRSACAVHGQATGDLPAADTGSGSRVATACAGVTTKYSCA